jgi:P-type Cu+ transporter
MAFCHHSPDQSTQTIQSPYLIPSLITGLGFALGLGDAFNLLPKLEGAGLIFGWMLALITLGLLWIAGASYYQGAWKSFKKMQFNMSSLVALGTGAAVLYSVLILCLAEHLPIQARHLHFDAALMIMGVITLGGVLEHQLSLKTHAGLDQLKKEQPKMAWLESGKKMNHTAVETIRVGDIIRIKAGEQVPLDCLILEGESGIDLALLTGESKPVLKKPGDNLPTGAFIQEGSLRCRVTHPVKDSTLSQLIQLVEDAQKTKPEIGYFANRIAAYLTPLVILIALGTAGAWAYFAPDQAWSHALTCSLSVLLVACPCALNMAVPMSLVSGINRGVSFGILIQNGTALQKNASIDTLFFDKTGTLTQGKPSLSEIIVLGKQKKSDILKIAQALETHSTHPIAKAILAEASKGAPLKATQVKTIPGGGLHAMISDKKVYLGNASFLKHQGINVNDQVKQQCNQASSEGKTAILLAIDSALSGLLMVTDSIKPDVAEVISWFRKQGIKTVMLTGDHPATAEHVNTQLNLDAVHAQLLPKEKHAYIKKAKAAGQTVAMVGDGINDAAALALADVGFAIASGSDVAIANADIQLINPSFSLLIKTFRLSKAIMRNIKQNLAASLIYNLLLIPIAAGALYPHFGLLLNPVMASLAMACSSISVVLNALRLNRKTF